MGCAVSLVPSQKYNLAQLSLKTSRLCEQTTRQERLLLAKTDEGAAVLKILLSNIVIEAVVKLSQDRR